MDLRAKNVYNHMMNSRWLLPLGMCFVVAWPATVEAQRRGKGPHPLLSPFPFVEKRAGFPLVLPRPKQFNQMQALIASVGPDTIPAFKTPHNVVQLEYGVKTGGIAMVYEAQIVPGVKAETLFNTLLKARVFRDHQNEKMWTMVTVPDKRLLIMVSGTTPRVRDAMIESLQH